MGQKNDEETSFDPKKIYLMMYDTKENTTLKAWRQQTTIQRRYHKYSTSQQCFNNV